MQDIALQSSKILSLLCYVKIVTIFEPKVVAISARNTIMIKFANFVRLYFPHITTWSACKSPSLPIERKIYNQIDSINEVCALFTFELRNL